MKKINFTFLIAILMSMVGTNAIAAEVDGIYYDLSSSGNATVTYYSSYSTSNANAYKGNIAIPESVTYNNKTYKVTSIGHSAFRYCSDLTSVSIPSSVTSIGFQAFENCNALTKVIIDDLSSWCNIAFESNVMSNPLTYAKHLYNNKNIEITELIIPEDVTSLKNYVFYNCSGLTSVTITNSVTSIGSAVFSDCENLTSIIIGSNVTSIGYSAFDNCSGLNSITIPSSVTSIGDRAFYNCDGLTSVTIPNSVTSIGSSAFYGCSNLTSVKVPVTNFTEFCNNKVIGLISSYIGKPVALIDKEGNEIKEYVIPEDVTTIGEKAFYNCSGLTSITIPNSVTSIGSSAFNNCSNLTSLKVPVTNFTEFCNNKVIGLISSYGKPVTLIDKEGNEIKEYVIPEDATTIGEKAFYNCSGLTSITIPSSMTTIGSSAFYNCSGLTSITIPNSVTSIGSSAFNNCSNLTNIKTPVTNFTEFCNNKVIGLISSYIGKPVALIDKEGNEIKEYVIPEDVTTIGEKAFYNCSGLTSVTIPNSVTNISNSAFYNCSGLTSITIPSSVNSLGNGAFSSCTKLVNVTLNSNSIVSANRTYKTFLKTIFGDQVTNYVLGENVTSIGDYAFYKCEAVTSIIIPDNVTKIGDRAFDCSGLTSVSIPNSVTSIGSSAFASCSGLTSVIIPSNVNSIGDGAFSACYNLTNVTINSNSIVSANRTKDASIKSIFGGQVTNYIIGEKVTGIGDYTFNGCDKLTGVSIPNSLTTIGAYAFNNCTKLSSVTLGDNITSISSNAFPSTIKFYTKHKTKTLFSLWNGKYKNIYEQETSKSLAPPSLNLKSSTQTSLTFEILNMYNEYSYEYKDKKVTNNTIEVYNLYPALSASYSVIMKYDDQSYSISNTFITKSISPKVTAEDMTASSATIKGSYTQGDASVTSEKLIIDNVEYKGNEQFVKGLNPSTTYTIRYEIEVTYGENKDKKQTYNTTYKSGYSTVDRNFKTEALSLTTKQPKVVSLGNVIVSAEANVDDEEKNVGFEWRRTDWTDDFESNTGTAYMYEGTMEGYIRNLSTDKLWKYRPYYLSDAGTYYYGDWVGVDPTNISYFEPTVHTYAKIEINGNTALVKGYALGGSDEVTVQGFKYWKNAGTMRVAASDIPSTAQTVEVSGTVMEVNLSGLEYESTYNYVAFATTSKGTYYGEVQTFETGTNPTGIQDIKLDETSTENVHEIARYNMQGRRIATPEKGINIIKMSNGTTRKVFVK